MIATRMSSTRSSSFKVAVAAAFLAIALSVPTGAPAQTPPVNKPVTTPKQIGAWTILGWSQDYCSAERPVRGANSGGSDVSFIFARTRKGYRLALSTPEWDLTPQTEFPVELMIGPEFRSESKVRVVGPKLVMMELGAERELVDRIAAAPTLEIKAAQTAFKLPIEEFGDALAEVESCFDGVTRSVTNPFTNPKQAAKAEQAAPKPGAPAQASIKATAVNVTPEGMPPAASAKTNHDLIEEPTFLDVPGDKGLYRLEALVVRPAKADGPLPIALITHGKNATAAENQALRASLMLPQARDFASRGWLAVVVIRRGYGRSDGFPGVSRGAAYMTCRNSDLVRGFDTEADDLAGALKALATRPDADVSRVIAVGQSLGGGVVLAFAARRPAGLLATVNVSGGVWRTEGHGACDHADLIDTMATFGARSGVPSLWLYSENDSLFPPALVKNMHDAYAHAGGRAELRMFQPVFGDGHALFMDTTARAKWMLAVDAFLQVQQTPHPMVTGALTPDTTAR